MQTGLFTTHQENTMKATNILAAAVFATLAATAFAQQAGPDAGQGRHGDGRQERLKAADKDANGLISREEAQALPGLAAKFAKIDTNNDGNISAAELDAARAARSGSQRGQGWKKWDANGDGTLTRDEVASAPRLSQQFDAIDANRDGILTVEELQAAHGRFAGRGRPG